MIVDFKIPFVTPAELASVLAESAALEAMHKHIARNADYDYCEVLASIRVPADAPEHKHPGWLEWRLAYERNSGEWLYVGMIQRTPESEFEFHS